MKLQVQNWPPVATHRFGQVAEALIHLTDTGDGFLTLEDEEAFMQVGRWKGHYVIEWCQDFLDDGPNHKLARAAHLGSHDGVRKSEFEIDKTELLKLGEAFEILAAFYHGPVRPEKFRWRTLKLGKKPHVENV